MAYFAKLVKGQDYRIAGLHFKKDVENEVAQDLYEYLQGNAQFELREGDAADNGSNDDEALKELLKKDRGELDEIAEGLELNPKDYANKTEIAKAIIAAEKAGE